MKRKCREEKSRLRMIRERGKKVERNEERKGMERKRREKRMYEEEERLKNEEEGCWGSQERVGR